MKRAGNLWPRILDRDNVRRAFHRALRGKRDSAEARQFGANLETNLRQMADQLRAGSFPVGRFHQFVIHDPKERIITAPCFAERVLHHAIMNVCEPILDRWLIDDTFACRPGKGRGAALARAQQFAGRFAFFLKLDIRRYFDSISHDRLLERVAWRIKDRPVLELLERIVRTYRGALGRGVPIGSLTSQHLGNFYLGWFDLHVKHQLRVKGYVRYMDDMVLWAESTAVLQTTLEASRDFLGRELDLEVKDLPYLNRTSHGMDFLGCRVFQRHMILNSRSRRRFVRKLTRLEQAHEAGAIGAAELQQRATALTAFTQATGISSWQFRRRVLERLEVSGRRAPSA